MKSITGWVVSAGLFLGATAANAQVLAPYGVVSDIGGPYAAIPQEAPAPRYGPMLLPPQEVYTVVRENGFSPLGAPHQRGFVYTIAVIDRRGDDGRLVIDARTGRIIRFVPAYASGETLNEDPPVIYGSPGAGSLPPISRIRGVPRPPASIPRVASRTNSVPIPKESPPRADEAKPSAAAPAPAPAQQSASAKPSSAPTTPDAAAATVGQAKPAAPSIQPTQVMPKVQGLE
jgi:hypothetical protein